MLVHIHGRQIDVQSGFVTPVRRVGAGTPSPPVSSSSTSQHSSCSPPRFCASTVALAERSPTARTQTEVIVVYSVLVIGQVAVSVLLFHSAHVSYQYPTSSVTRAFGMLNDDRTEQVELL